MNTSGLRDRCPDEDDYLQISSNNRSYMVRPWFLYRPCKACLHLIPMLVPRDSSIGKTGKDLPKYLISEASRFDTRVFIKTYSC
jgi:hypothetical protein